MNEMPHQNRLASNMSNQFRTFATEMEKRMPGCSDVYALYDSDGRYLVHRALNPALSGSDFSGSFTDETFLALPSTAAFAASRLDRSFRTAALDLPSRDPQLHPCFLAVLPVLIEDECYAYLIRLSKPIASETEVYASMQLAVMAFAALARAERSEAVGSAAKSMLEEQRKVTRRRETLFAMCMRIHTRNDANDVLTELMQNVDELMPGHSFEIYVSHDQHWTLESVKPLKFGQSDEDSLFRAFTEGKSIVAAEADGKPSDAYFPLRGKQGVYGVLRMSLTDRKRPKTAAMNDMTMLSDAAGGALENARLYEQANRLVGELRLINEITQRLNQSLKLQDIFHFASMELRHIFSAEFCCILELVDDGRELVVRASEPASFVGERFAADYGFSGQVLSTKEPIIIGDCEVDRSIRSVWVETTRARSLLASPILVEGQVVGVILVAHRNANYFSYDNYKLLQTLSGHIGLAVSNASLHAEVRKMVQTDRLTGLFARHVLDDQIGSRQKKDYCGSLIVVDIDNFKKVNDTYGHQVGDRVLIQVSSIVRSCIREGDIASRWGGEELAVYLVQASKDQALRVAERIRLRVNAETSPKVSVSCGVSDWDWEDEKISVESLFYRADMALYRAKHSGKNRIFTG